MAADVPIGAPDVIRAGDTIKWDADWPDYLPADSWSGFYELVNAAGTIDAQVTGSTNGSYHRFEIAAGVTTAWSANAGELFYIGYVSKAGERFTLDRGSLIVRADLEVTATHDGRSHVKTVLDAIEATIEGRASKDQESYSINGVSLARTPLAELIDLRLKYLAEYETEKRKLAIEKGEGHSGRVRTRFARP